ncbi:hypothetical protein NL676_024933 [Syzygium grande]|nr:hypothetical protein NL676_024933 [Syzygium grande]
MRLRRRRRRWWSRNSPAGSVGEGGVGEPVTHGDGGAGGDGGEAEGLAAGLAVGDGEGGGAAAHSKVRWNSAIYHTPAYEIAHDVAETNTSHMNRDSPKNNWPESVGQNAHSAKAIIEKDNPQERSPKSSPPSALLPRLPRPSPLPQHFFDSIPDLSLLRNHSKVLYVSTGAAHEVMALPKSDVADVTGVNSPPLMEMTTRVGGACVVVAEECSDVKVEEIVGLFRKSRFEGTVNVTLIGLKMAKVIL